MDAFKRRRSLCFLSDPGEKLMSFRITILDPAPVRFLFGLSEAELAKAGGMRYITAQTPRFFDQVSLRDVKPGKTVLLLSFMYQPAQTQDQASQAIFIKKYGTAS